MQIGRIERVPLRELWPNEAQGFTIWLAENLDILQECVGLELSFVEREASAGVFSADILAEDSDGRQVVIENQLEKTNHDHLGKLVTYMSNLEAKVAIWIASDPRPEHEQAVQWLNEVLPADTAFYLVRLDAVRIEDSPCAPMLSVVSGPSEEVRQIGTQKKQQAERHILRREFWTQLLEKANQKTDLHSSVSPNTDTWLNAGAGKSGLVFQYRIRMPDAQVGLRIRRKTAEDGRRLFDALHTRKEAIETAFGGQLEWVHREGTRTYAIVQPPSPGGLVDQDRWSDIQNTLVDAMVRLEQTLGPEIKKLR